METLRSWFLFPVTLWMSPLPVESGLQLRWYDPGFRLDGMQAFDWLSPSHSLPSLARRGDRVNGVVIGDGLLTMSWMSETGRCRRVPAPPRNKLIGSGSPGPPAGGVFGCFVRIFRTTPLTRSSTKYRFNTWKWLENNILYQWKKYFQ